MWLQILLTVLQIWCWRTLSFLSQWDHTYRLPRNTSQTRLGWAPSAVLQTLLNEPQTYVHQHKETTVLFNEFYGLAVGLVAGEAHTTELGLSWPHSGRGAGGPRGCGSWSSVLQDSRAQVLTMWLVYSWPPASDLLHARFWNTKFHFRWPQTTYNTLTEFIFRKLQLPTQTPVERESLIECVGMTFRTNSHHLP